MIGTFIKGALLFGVLFSASAVSTVAVSKQLNKTAVPNNQSIISEENTQEYIEDEEEDEEEEYVVPVHKKTDTEAFISSLTSFGNLCGDIHADITYQNLNCEISGNVFVSLETLEDLAISLDLDISIPNYNLNLKAAYIDDTVFINANDNKVKLETNKISEITELINSLDLQIELPEIFQNIDTDEILNNLGSMESNKDESKITYTCYLLKGIPPIIFTSDLDYNMTHISLNGEVLGINLGVEASTEILGKGHNEIVNPETLGEKYIDVTSYFGVVKQVKDLVDQKKFSLNYQLSANKEDEQVISSNGRFDIDLDKLNASAKTNFTIKDATFAIDAAYLDEKVYVSYNDSIKLSYSKNKIIDLVNVIKQYVGNDALNSLIEKLGVNAWPLLDCLNSKDYLKLLNYFDGVKIDENQITITINNEIFGEEASEAKIIVNLGNNKLNSLQISNLIVLDYTFNLSLDLVDFVAPTIIDKESYSSLDSADGLVSDIFSLTKQDKFQIGLSGSITDDKGTISISGNTQFDIKTLSGYGHASIVDKNGKNHKVDIDIYDDSRLYFSYNNKLNGTFTLTSIREVIDIVKKLASDGNPRIEKYSSQLASDFSTALITKIIKGDYLSIIKDNLVKSFVVSGDMYTIEIDGALIGGTDPIIINLSTVDNKLSSLSVSLNVLGMNISLSASLETFDENYSHLNVANMSFYDFTDISTSVEYVLTVAANNDFALSGTLNIDMNAIGIITRNFDLGFDVKVHIDEDENVVSCLRLTNIPNIKLAGINVVQSEKWDNRTFEIYISDNYVNLRTITEITETKMTGLFKFEDIKTTTVKSVHLTNQEMVDNLIYYFVNFGLGIDKIDLSNTSGTDTTNMKYEDIVSNYAYSEANNVPTWNIGIDLAEIVGNDMLGDVNATITGDTSTKLLSTLDVTLGINVKSLLTVDIKLDATLDSVAYIGDANLKAINDFNSLCSTYVNKEIQTSSTSTKI